MEVIRKKLVSSSQGPHTLLLVDISIYDALALQGNATCPCIQSREVEAWNMVNEELQLHGYQPVIVTTPSSSTATVYDG